MAASAPTLDVRLTSAGHPRHVQQRDQLARGRPERWTWAASPAELARSSVHGVAVPAPGTVSRKRSVERRVPVPCVSPIPLRSLEDLRRTTAPALLLERRTHAVPCAGRFPRQEARLYRERTWGEYAELVARAAKGLAALGR